MKSRVCYAALMALAAGAFAAGCGGDEPTTTAGVGGGSSASGTGSGGTGGGGSRCSAASDCDDGTACTTDACQSESCSNTPIDPNDNNACTIDACDAKTGVSHTPIDLNDNNACTIDACDPTTGVSHTPVDPNDNNACTVDACDSSTGISHAPVDPNDNNACTVDACDPSTGISHTPIDPNDNNACTVDACDVVAGVSHAPIDPNDNNTCTIDACDVMTGVSHTPVDPSDANACTADACDPLGGVTHTPIDPNDNNPCTLDSCDMATGVKNQAQIVLFSEDFSDNTAGWTLGTEWQIGSAKASVGGEYGADPAADHTPTNDNGVAGVNLGGNAIVTADHGFYYIESPPINAAVVQGEVVLSFWRWLNSDYSPYMNNRVEAWDGAQWQIVWSSGAPPAIQDSPPVGSGWTNVRFTLTPYAKNGLRVRFGFDMKSLGVYTVGSWNLDDIEVLNVPFAADGDMCTIDGCDPATGATYTPVVLDDANLCTTDTCDPARQVYHAGTDCSAFASDCADAACLPATGQCGTTPKNQGLACDDSNGCTSTEICNNGVCAAPGGPGFLFYESFTDNSQGWTLQGQWQIGPAQSSSGCAVCTGNDPSTDHTDATVDNGVAGVGIGTCSTGGAGMCLTSPPVNTMIAGPVYVDFWRHAHLDFLTFQSNTIEVFNGSSWSQIYVNNTGNCVNDAQWSNQVHDVTAHKNAAFRVRFCTANLNNAYNAGNWTIDDLTIGPNICTP
jgi:hypothetical protein